MANRPEGVMNRVPFGQVKNRPLMFAYFTLMIKNLHSLLRDEFFQNKALPL